VSCANTVRATKTVITQTDLTSANKTVSLDMKDDETTETDIDGTNDCDLILPSISVHANGKPTLKTANNRALGEATQ